MKFLKKVYFSYLNLFIKDNKKNVTRKLFYVCGICCLLMIAEAIGGFLAHSLAIMTDAAHLLSDLAGFFFSIFSIYIATKPKNSKFSFGFHRS